MDVTKDFFGKLRDLALAVEKEVKQLERALRREDVGKRSPGLGLLARFALPPVPLSSSGRGISGEPGSCSCGNCVGSSQFLVWELCGILRLSLSP